ncbi:MAG: hypothetical protein V4582_02780 [Pseudomonadota bacterium]
MIAGSVALLALNMLFPAMAQAQNCSSREQEAADAMLDHLDNWQALAVAHKNYGQCDDGSIAEGYSEAVARLLVDHWHSVPTLANMIRTDRSFKRFVLHHIDSTLDTRELERIIALASASCPPGLQYLCGELRVSAKRALSDQQRSNR